MCGLVLCHILEITVDDSIIRPPCLLVLLTIAHSKLLDFHARLCPVKRAAAYRRDQQRQTHNICKEAGSKQKRPCKEDHSAIRQRLGRIVQFIEGPFQVCKLTRSLTAHQIGTGNRCREHNQQCPPDTDQTSDLNEQGDFDHRNRNECEKKPHG